MRPTNLCCILLACLPLLFPTSPNAQNQVGGGIIAGQAAASINCGGSICELTCVDSASGRRIVSVDNIESADAIVVDNVVLFGNIRRDGGKRAIVTVTDRAACELIER